MERHASYIVDDVYRRFIAPDEDEATYVRVGRVATVCLVVLAGVVSLWLADSLVAAVYEALIAAIYLDGGLDAARDFILEDMSDQITAAAASENQQNFKSHLQQYAQKLLGCTPVYEILDEKGPDHSKCFEVCVALDGKRFPSAWGPSKKEAEQQAALSALCDLQVVEEDTTS